MTTRTVKDDTTTSEAQPIKAPTRFVPAGGPKGFLSSFWKAAASGTSAAKSEEYLNQSASLTGLPSSRR